MYNMRTFNLDKYKPNHTRIFFEKFKHIENEPRVHDAYDNKDFFKFS